MSLVRLDEIDFDWSFVAGSGEPVDWPVNDDRVEAARTAFDAAANQAADPSWRSSAAGTRATAPDRVPGAERSQSPLSSAA